MPPNHRQRWSVRDFFRQMNFFLSKIAEQKSFISGFFEIFRDEHFVIVADREQAFVERPVMQRAERKTVADAVVEALGERVNVRGFDGGFSVDRDETQAARGAGVIVETNYQAAKSDVAFRSVFDLFRKIGGIVFRLIEQKMFDAADLTVVGDDGEKLFRVFGEIRFDEPAAKRFAGFGAVQENEQIFVERGVSDEICQMRHRIHLFGLSKQPLVSRFRMQMPEFIRS